ncbi:MAG: hypothetical protein QNJ12_13605 [Ilumatobacter sp.]|uniref:hypothetical protein n=1 Tax=Ilumatobacter sp. TaxID=1967498 RepID=UPI00262C6CD3|nr:hypothetical protein [Ilumatobacter sp.]MDJ0769832.1 hypothetical protein [Ilumatobacter sp.]
MVTKSRGRGTAAAIGLLLLFAGLIGGAVLFVLSVRRPTQAVDGFARAAVGCTTTLDFSESGTFYVYREVDGIVDLPDGSCDPTATQGREFGFEISGPSGAIDTSTDDSISYETDDFIGTSVARIEIDEPGEYEIDVVGDDVLNVAAVGRDPDDGVDELRRGAIIVAAVGVLLGLLLLVVAGRRSKKAAEVAIPDGPGWGTPARDGESAWPPRPPSVPQVPVSPHQPDHRAEVEPPPPPLPSREPASPAAWAPPPMGSEPSDAGLPDPPPSSASPVPMPEPTLPASLGRPSGVSPDAPPPDGDDEVRDGA